ncbi:hypothetical protein GE21DRAFT_1117874 [Neurospora crassa]|nr:hypothetical protein GE21DRAFT_1117874 [Neurospora crassa]
MKGSSGTGNATRMHSKPSSLCIALCRRPNLLWFQVCQRRLIPERLRTLQAAVCSCSFLVIWFSVFSGHLVSSYLNRPYRAYQCRRDLSRTWSIPKEVFLTVMFVGFSLYGKQHGHMIGILLKTLFPSNLSLLLFSCILHQGTSREPS